VSMRKALGKGLNALIPDIDQYSDVKDVHLYCNVNDIQPNRFQPRKGFSEERLEDLVLSIKEKGVIQPILVRRYNHGYELIAGERRWSAAKRAGMTEVPVIVTEASDTEALELSLIENIQREDLNSLDEAEAYDRLRSEFNLTQEKIARKVGKNRSTITNFLRLLKLPSEIREGLSKNIITMGHARAFLSLETPDKQRDAYNKVVKRGLSVRQTESLVRQRKTKKAVPVYKEDHLHLESVKNELVKRLDARVKIVSRKTGKGRIEIDFSSLEDLDRIIKVLKG